MVKFVYYFDVEYTPRVLYDLKVFIKDDENPPEFDMNNEEKRLIAFYKILYDFSSGFFHPECYGNAIFSIEKCDPKVRIED